MCINSKSLKTIFQNHFFSFWDKNKHKFPQSLHDDIFSNVGKFLNCGDPNLGFREYICPKCNFSHIAPLSCKSRFCSSCGKVYAENWALKLEDSLINCQHLHMTFSLPKGFIRDFFFYNRLELAQLAQAAFSAISYAFKKLGIHNIGVITNIHTFARDVSWNSHIHAIVTFGGLDKNNNWKHIKFLPWMVLRKSWQKCTLDILAKHAKKTHNTNLKNKISLAYKNYPNGFYVNSDNKINNTKTLAKYLARYLARPSIAEYRIVWFNESLVKFWYEAPDSDSKIYVTLPIDQFIGRLVSHIPPKNFKMVRRFGLYSRRVKNKIPKKSRLFLPKISWADRIFRSFGYNPLKCPRCGSQLQLVEIVHLLYGTLYSKDTT